MSESARERNVADRRAWVESGRAASGGEFQLAAVRAGQDSRVYIGNLLPEAREKRLPIFLHAVGRIFPDRVFVALHLIDKARSKPLQVAVEQALPFSVGSLDKHNPSCSHERASATERAGAGSNVCSWAEAATRTIVIPAKVGIHKPCLRERSTRHVHEFPPLRE